MGLQVEFSGDAWRQVVEQAPVMIWRAGGLDGCDYFNATWLRFTGRAPAQELRWGWLDGVHADDAERCRRAHEEALRAGRAFEVEYRLRRADGAYRWVLARGAPAVGDEAPAGFVGSCTDITDLRASEAHYRQVVEHLPQMPWVADAEGNILSANPRWADRTGRPLAEALGSGWQSAIHPGDRPAVERGMAEMLARGEAGKIRHRVRMADGSYRWIEAQASPHRDASGRIVRWHGVNTDIHEQVIAEERLRESEAHYRHTVDLAPQVPFTMDPQGRVLEISRRWDELTGETQDSARGHGWLVATHPDDAAEVQAALQQAIRSGTPYDQRSRKRLADGSYRWFRVRAFPRRDAAGAITNWYGYAEDIDEQVEAEQALRESRAQLATIFDQALVGIALCVAGGGILLANERLCQILGREMGSLANLMLSEVTHPDDLGWSLPLFAEHERSGDPYVIERRYLRPDGTSVWCRVHVAFVPRGEGERPLTVTLVEDISQQRAASAEIERLRATLMRTSRMSAMGAMGAAIAHELNQPLAAVTNYLQAGSLLLRQAEDVTVLAEVLDKAAGQALRAGEIIRRLRGLVIKGAVVTAPEDLSKLVADTNTVGLAGVDDAGVTCRLELTPGIVVAADRVQLQQVLFNLMRNAVEAMQGAERKELVVSTAVREREALVTVEDSGPGLRPEIRANLFAPFTTSKDGGMGIGLAICKTIVEAHRGAIWAEEGTRGGARFCFTLPLADARNGPPRD